MLSALKLLSSAVDAFTGSAVDVASGGMVPAGWTVHRRQDLDPTGGDDVNDQAAPGPAQPPSAAVAGLEDQSLAHMAAGLARAYAERERPARKGRLHRV